jgi:hypothetical protein
MDIEELWHVLFRLRICNQRLRTLAEKHSERKEFMALLDASNADLTILGQQIAAIVAANQALKAQVAAAAGTSAPQDVQAAADQDLTIDGYQAQLTAAGYAPPAAPAAPAQS